jgi:hypothetical protein
MEDDGIFYALLVYFTAIWYFYDHLISFSRFGMLHQEKSGNLAFYSFIVLQPTVLFTNHSSVSASK